MGKNSVTSIGTAQRAHLPRAFSRWGLLGAAQKLCELPASQPRPPSASPRGRGGRLGGKASGPRGPLREVLLQILQGSTEPTRRRGIRRPSGEAVGRGWRDARVTQGLCACAASPGPRPEAGGGPGRFPCSPSRGGGRARTQHSGPSGCDASSGARCGTIVPEALPTLGVWSSPL